MVALTPNRSRRETSMDMLKKDHILGSVSAALLGGIVVGGIGWFIAGPVGLTAGVVVGGALGAVLGHRASEAVDPRDDIGHFEQIYTTMPYYVVGHDWNDYAPAYRYGLDTYKEYPGQALSQVESQLQGGWEAATRFGSRLQWSQVRPVVAHAWESLDQAHAREARTTDSPV